LRLSEGAPVNLTTLTLSAHTGTHADAYYHYEPDDLHPAAMPLDAYIGKARVVTVTRRDGPLMADDFAHVDLTNAERLLIHSHVSDLPDDVWPEAFPYLSVPLIERLAFLNIRLVGLDSKYRPALPSCAAAAQHGQPGNAEFARRAGRHLRTCCASAEAGCGVRFTSSGHFKAVTILNKSLTHHTTNKHNILENVADALFNVRFPIIVNCERDNTMQGLALLFFFAFAVIILMTYLALRRGWAAPGKVAAVGMIGSIITMSLSMVSQPNVPPVQAIFFGVVVGAGFAGAALAVAWYFQRNELRTHTQS
jgi:hypothetical protein